MNPFEKSDDSKLHWGKGFDWYIGTKTYFIEFAKQNQQFNK